MQYRNASMERAMQLLSVLCCAALAVFTLLDIGMRLLHAEFFLANELNRVFLAWAIFFALPMVTRKREHLRVDFLLNMLKPGARRVLEALSDLLTMAYIGILILLLSSFAYGSWVDGVRSQGMLRLPEAYAQAGLVISLVLAVFSQVAIVLCRRNSDIERQGD